MKLVIRNMVCNRCVMAVKEIFARYDLVPLSMTLGEVVIAEDRLPSEKLALLDAELKAVGFERIDDKRSKVIERLKSVIVQKIHHSDFVDRKFNWSVILSDELGYDYKYLSGLFSSVEGVTLEHYIILQKIERVKELLFYDELNINEIADRLGYSSVQHLSSQFKRITGSTPTAYKKSHVAGNSRRSLDSL